MHCCMQEVFPADEPDKLEEFKHAIKLVQLIVECQHEVRPLSWCLWVERVLNGMALMSCSRDSERHLGIWWY